MIEISCSAFYVDNPKKFDRKFKVANNETKKYKEIKEKEKVEKLF